MEEAEKSFSDFLETWQIEKNIEFVRIEWRTNIKSEFKRLSLDFSEELFCA